MAYSILVSAQDPLVFGFWFWGLRVWGQGLTTFHQLIFIRLAQTYFWCVAVSAVICAAHGAAAGSQASAAGEITGKVVAEYKVIASGQMSLSMQKANFRSC